jgi:hypothetical protein
MESYPLTEEFLKCKTAEEFSTLTGEKCIDKMVLPSFFAVPPIYLRQSSRKDEPSGIMKARKGARI